MCTQGMLGEDLKLESRLGLGHVGPGRDQMRESAAISETK